MLATIRHHARHLVLGALVAGLLLAPAGPPAVFVAALLAGALGGRPRVALLAAAAVLGGAAFADARLAALDAGRLAALHGRTIESRAVLLEPLRVRAAGPAVARIRLLDGPAAGEQAVLRARRTLAGGGAPGGAGPPSGDRAGRGGAPGGAGAARGGAGGRRAPEVGDILSVKGRVEPLGVFDAYQRRRNAHAAIAAVRAVPTGERRGGVAGALDSVRRRGERGLARGLAAPEAALLRGMVLGQDERLSEAVRDDFKRSGLAHILAVSGQNVMLLAALVLGACALTGVPLRTRLLLAVAVITVYVPLAGGGPSIQRAGVMGVAGLVAALAGRPARRWYALLLAAALTLALNPRAAAEPGWQLSFAAVAALLIGAAPLRAVLERRWPRAVAEAAAITIAATVGTAPLMALYFQQVSLAALPANLVAAPAIAPVMWLGVLAAAAAQIAAPLAAPFTALAAPLLVYIQHVAHITAASPWSVVEIRASPLVIGAAWLAVAAAAGAALRRWSRTNPDLDAEGHERRRAPRRLLPLFAAVAAAVALHAHLAARGAALPAPDEVVVSFLDIGQGDATLVQRGRTAVLVDTGPAGGPIVERLREAGIERLDALVLTHAQADHEGAAPAVMNAFTPRLVVDGGAGWPNRALPRATPSRTRIHAPAAGDVIGLGGLRFEVLWPPPRAPGWRASGDPNEHALVARLEAGGLTVLLTADAESGVTAPLRLGPVDVLKVAHHGSADPGLPALLARVQPRIAAIEVGRGNSYGHPAPSTLAALNAVPTVLRTDRDGTARVHAAKGRMWIER